MRPRYFLSLHVPVIEYPPKLLQAGTDHQKHKGGAGHWKGRNAPVCRECRVTLSNGICLNRSCGLFNTGVQR